MIASDALKQGVSAYLPICRFCDNLFNHHFFTINDINALAWILHLATVERVDILAVICLRLLYRCNACEHIVTYEVDIVNSNHDISRCIEELKLINNRHIHTVIVGNIDVKLVPTLSKRQLFLGGVRFC